MPLRELTDRTGRSWKVWDITPEQLHPSTRSGDRLQGFVDGWLVFETADGTEKRRLYPVPRDWHELDDDALARLCERAESVRGSRERSERAEERAPEPPRRPAGGSAADRQVARTFSYPGGRVWTVTEQYIQLRDRMGEPLDTRTVLRFTSGVRSLDLHAWPSEWRDYSDEELADLLARAFPRDREAASSGPHRRRRSDQRA